MPGFLSISMLLNHEPDTNGSVEQVPQSSDIETSWSENVTNAQSLYDDSPLVQHARLSSADYLSVVSSDSDYPSDFIPRNLSQELWEGEEPTNLVQQCHIQDSEHIVPNLDDHAQATLINLMSVIAALERRLAVVEARNGPAREASQMLAPIMVNEQEPVHFVRGTMDAGQANTNAAEEAVLESTSEANTTMDETPKAASGSRKRKAIDGDEADDEREESQNGDEANDEMEAPPRKRRVMFPFKPYYPVAPGLRLFA